MNVTILLITLLIPGVVLDGTECHYVEFNDHFEAICVGDERYEAVSQALAKGQLAMPPAHHKDARESADQTTSSATRNYSVATSGSTDPVTGDHVDTVAHTPVTQNSPAKLDNQIRTLPPNNASTESDRLQQPKIDKSGGIPSMYRAPRSILGTPINPKQ